MRIGILAAGAALVLLAACEAKQTPAATESAAAPQAEAVKPAVVNTLTIDLMSDDQPVVSEKLASPLVVEGMAPARHYFEAQFPVRLMVNGQAIAEAPARSQDDWTNGAAMHPFKAELTFSVTQETKAELVFEEDMPGQDDNGNDVAPQKVSIPVTLVPSS